MRKLRILFSAALAAFFGCSGGPVTDPYARQVDAVYERLTLEERAAQLFGLYPGELMENGRVSLEKCREVIPYGVGHICQPTSSQYLDPGQIRQMVADIQDYLMNGTGAGIPAIFQEEALTGLTAKGATAFPQAIGTACSWNPGLVRTRTARTAGDMRAIGQQLALSPMMDVIRSAHWPRIEESCGEDGYLCAVMGSAFVDGLQQKGFREGIAATTKHFLGYGGGSSLPWKEIYEEVLLPHEAIIRKCGTESVMTSYDKFHADYAVCSDTLINVLLRGYLGYRGAVISDYGAVQQGSRSRDPEELKRFACEALNAGNDLELAWNTSYRYIPELVRSGAVSEAAFEKAVKRVLLLKARAGLLDAHPALYAEGPLEPDTPEHRKLAYEIAAQSVVLLKNDGILPLPSARKIALVGPNANSCWAMLGDYTYPSMQMFFFRNEMNPPLPGMKTLYEALRAACPGDVSYARGCDWSTLADMRIAAGGDKRARSIPVRRLESPDPTDRAAALKLAAGSDVIVAAMGENLFLCGENRIRNGIRLPGDQEQFVKDLIATGKPVVLVIFGGRPQVIDTLAPGCAAILEAWYPGQMGAEAVSDILTGKVNPSGRLCVSYPATESTEPLCYNNLPAPERVAYPFGFGLSYTDFRFSDIQVQPEARTRDKSVTVRCRVSNVGSRSGDEVVQLYVSPASGQPLKPLQLKGFQRVRLQPGESATVTFRLAVDQLAWWSQDPADGRSVWTVSDGDYRIRIGSSSADLPLEGICRLKGKPIRKALRDEYFSTAVVSPGS